MRLKYALVKCGLVAVSLMAFLVIYENNTRESTPVVEFLVSKEGDDKLGEQHQYLVDTPTCKIPNVSPYDTSIVHLLQPGQKIVCNKYTNLTYSHNNVLFINVSSVMDKFSHCIYQPINRPQFVTDHNYYRYGAVSKQFKTNIRVKESFIRVRCYNKGTGLMYTNFHSFIQNNNIRDQRKRKLFNTHKSRAENTDQLSVTMVGVDSVSRLNFMRYMKRTRSVLLGDLGAVDLQGYNKVADNTFVNIVPMTMGKFLEDIPWNESMSNKPFDSYNFIWKQYSNKGYTTLYAEDQPKIAIFDFLKAGFHQSPADYFNRHFTLAMEKEHKLWYKRGKCFGTRLETDMVLHYLEQFENRYKDRPRFSFSFITGLTHDFLENSAAADEPYFTFLTKLSSTGSLNNTVLLFFSDHGLRFGKVRNSFVGRLEERLPFMYIVFPPWFKNKYPFLINNLKTNARRLTTPFDIYETLVDILHFKDRSYYSRTPVSNKRGISLLSEIPENRTCEDASILPHWCTCAHHIKLSPIDKNVRTLSANIVHTINEYLVKYNNLCEQLYVDSIIEAEKLVLSDKVLKFKESRNDVIGRHVSYGDKAKAYVDYQLTLKTRPGGAIFEATIQHNEIDDLYEIRGDISRINLYGDQSHCISNHNLKKYCYCKS